MSGRSSRTKGHAFERRIAKELRESGLFPEAKRGFQTRGGTSEEADVKNTGKLFIECKAHKKVDRKAAWRQAYEAARPGQIPVAVCKDDRQPVVAVLPLAALSREVPFDTPVEDTPLVEIKWDYFKLWLIPMLAERGYPEVPFDTPVEDTPLVETKWDFKLRLTLTLAERGYGVE